MPTRCFFPGGAFPPFFEGVGPSFPDYELTSIDDEQVKGVLLTLGVTQLFTDGPAPTRPGMGETRGFLVADHPTHWLLFERHEHWPKEKDNGYVLVGWPRSKFTKEQFSEELRRYMNDTCSGPVQFRTAGRNKS